MKAIRDRLQERWGYGAMYVFIFLAGLFSFIFPSSAVEEILNAPQSRIWSTFFVFGGMASFFGLAIGSYVGETLGLPLIFSALSVYGVVLFTEFADQPERGGILFIGLVFFSFAFALLARWTEAMKAIKIARKLKDGP